MLDLVDRDFGDDSAADAVLSAWQAEAPDVSVNAAVTVAVRPKPSATTEIGVLFHKNARLLFLDPISYLMRMVMFVGASCLFSVIYIEGRQREQDQVISRLWLAMWLMGATTALGIVLIYLVNQDFSIVKREVKDGLYSPLTFVLAQTCLSLPMLALMALCAVAPALYPIGNWRGEGFGRAYVTMFLSLASFEFNAEFLAVAFANPLVGMLVYLNLWFLSFVFCGVFVEISAVPWPLRLFSYLSPLRWAINELVHAAFAGESYDGAETCSSSTSLAAAGTSLAGQEVSCPRGFYCAADASGVHCWGRTDDEILAGLSSAFSTVETDDYLGRDLGIIAAIAVFSKGLYLLMFIRRSRTAETSMKPAAAASAIV